MANEGKEKENEKSLRFGQRKNRGGGGQTGDSFRGEFTGQMS